MTKLIPLAVVLSLAAPARGESFYQTGFTYTLKGADATAGLRDATIHRAWPQRAILVWTRPADQPAPVTMQGTL